MEKLLKSATPAEYFKDLVERAMSRQRVSSSELSSYYLVQLLESFVASDQMYAEMEIDKDAPLAELLCQALAERGSRRFALLRFTGDLALFVSGFFSDSITRRRLDLDYYVRLGGYAYGGAARLSRQELSSVFNELALKFARFVDVLNEVSEESGFNERGDVLRLYRSWLETGSKRSEMLLRHEGIVLSESARRIH